jgi:hypothetical protein
VGALVLRLAFWVGVAALALRASKLAKMPQLT